MPDATFACPDLSSFASLDELGLVVVGQRLEPDRAVLAARVVNPDEWCHRCGCPGCPRDTVTRRLAHEPFGWRPTTLLVRVRRYRCTGCGHVWRQDMSKAAEPRARLSRRAVRWALEAISGALCLQWVNAGPPPLSTSTWASTSSRPASGGARSSRAQPVEVVLGPTGDAVSGASPAA